METYATKFAMGKITGDGWATPAVRLLAMLGFFGFLESDE
jgi:hypothetical protein